MFEELISIPSIETEKINAFENDSIDCNSPKTSPIFGDWLKVVPDVATIPLTITASPERLTSTAGSS